MAASVFLVQCFSGKLQMWELSLDKEDTFGYMDDILMNGKLHCFSVTI